MYIMYIIISSCRSFCSHFFSVLPLLLLTQVTLVASQYDHECGITVGVEPNYDDEHCNSFYSCESNWGSLEYCPDGYQVCVCFLVKHC